MDGCGCTIHIKAGRSNCHFGLAETIKRIIRKLEKEGYLLSANYNRLKMDKTKWYSINYEKVSELWDEETDSTGQIDYFMQYRMLY